MKLYARLETKYNYNGHPIDKVVKHYTAEEVFNEYWTYWVNRVTPPTLTTKDNCLTAWLKVYNGWIDESENDPDHDSHDDETYNEVHNTTLNKTSTKGRGLKCDSSVNYTIKEITLKELYDTLAASLFDIAHDRVIDQEDDNYYYFKILSCIAYGDIEGIRSAFVNGNSALLIPDILECIEEIRIYDNTKLLMVVVGDEIQY